MTIIREKKAVRVEQLKSDLLATMEYVYNNYRSGKKGFIFKEDDFVTCIATDDIINFIISRNLEDKVVSLGYGFGFMYIPAAKMVEFLKYERTCRTTIGNQN